jgi:hypothetical protein
MAKKKARKKVRGISRQQLYKQLYRKEASEAAENAVAEAFVNLMESMEDQGSIVTRENVVILLAEAVGKLAASCDC